MKSTIKLSLLAAVIISFAAKPVLAQDSDDNGASSGQAMEQDSGSDNTSPSGQGMTQDSSGNNGAVSGQMMGQGGQQKFEARKAKMIARLQ